MCYRLGTLRFDVNRRDDEMFQCMRAAMNSLTNAKVMDDTAGLLGFIDSQDKAKPGPVGCVGYCMSGQYITAAAATFPHRIKSAASLYGVGRSEEHTSELQSLRHLVCRLLLEKKKKRKKHKQHTRKDNIT